MLQDRVAQTPTVLPELGASPTSGMKANQQYHRRGTDPPSYRNADALTAIPRRGRTLVANRLRHLPPVPMVRLVGQYRHPVRGERAARPSLPRHRQRVRSGRRGRPCREGPLDRPPRLLSPHPPKPLDQACSHPTCPATLRPQWRPPSRPPPEPRPHLTTFPLHPPTVGGLLHPSVVRRFTLLRVPLPIPARNLVAVT